MIAILSAIPWPKLAYSAVLLAIAGIVIVELLTIWSDGKVYLGAFETVSIDADAEADTQFPAKIVSSQSVLANLILSYQRGSSDSTYELNPATAIYGAPFAGLDITYQDINITQIFGAVHKLLSQPGEVRGIVTTTQSSVQVAIDWSGASGLAPDLVTGARRLLTPARPSTGSAAYYVACALSWAQIAKTTSPFAALTREQFCDWSEALSLYFGLSGQPSADPDEKPLRAAISRLRTLEFANPKFADSLRLRADLTDLLPEGKRTNADLVAAQEARVRYAVMTTDWKGIPEDEQRLAALALARPAVIIGDSGLEGLKENWAPILQPQASTIVTVARSVGVLMRNETSDPIGLGFVVAPGVVATADYMARNLKEELEKGTVRLCFGKTLSGCETSLAVGKIIYAEDKSGFGSKGMVLLELLNHDPLIVPPVAVADPLPAAGDVVGRYTYVIGYPSEDPRMPKALTKWLLGDTLGVKRVMPGRILALGRKEDSTAPLITSDTLTTVSGGGPLIDLTTGKVLGIVHSGVWQDDVRGKFQYSVTFPPAAMAEIQRRLTGEEEQPAAEPTQTPQPSSEAKPPE
jgi:hypothetical protein